MLTWNLNLPTDVYDIYESTPCESLWTKGTREEYIITREWGQTQCFVVTQVRVASTAKTWYIFVHNSMTNKCDANKR